MMTRLFASDPFYPIGPFDARFILASLVANRSVYYHTEASPQLAITITATTVFAILLVISADQ
jgi:hypothetical protein